MQWNLEQIRLFVSVAERQSFSAAARELKRVQSAVSNGIALLEADLGVTLFGALSGLYRYQGSARLEGTELSRHRRRLTGRMGFVTQSPQDQFVADTVLDEVTVSLRHSAGAGDPAAGAEEVLRRIQLWRFRRLSPYMLSQGQQRRLGVAALLAYDCQVLVCDEPTYAQDRGRTAAIMDALQREVVERGLTLILSTHDRTLAQDYADILYELKEGSLYEVAQSHL